MLAEPKYSISSLSLGSNTYHDLPTKMKVASELGYDGIEIFSEVPFLVLMFIWD
jgi:4-hydroxyphenylpyruvate dioxygenase